MNIITKEFPYDDDLKYSSDALGFNSQGHFRICSRKNFYTYNVKDDKFDIKPILMNNDNISSGSDMNGDILYID